jgi:hypothetical protein
MAADGGSSVNSAATDHLPAFITPPGGTDVLMVVMAVILALAVLGFGILFLKLHSLPERMAHKSQKIQFEIVAVLGLISLFTHMHIFWIIGLLLALIDFPDFGGQLSRIAHSIESLAGKRSTASDPALPNVTAEEGRHSAVNEKGVAADGDAKTSAHAEAAPGEHKELSHA